MLLKALILFAISLANLEQPMGSILVIEDKDEIKRFRTSKDIFQGAKEKNINTVGLENLDISGSGTFNVENLIKRINTSLPIIVVDLRQESHFYVDGTPTTVFHGFKNDGNKNKTKSGIENDEYVNILNLRDYKGDVSFKRSNKKIFGIGYDYRGTSFSYQSVNTEKEEVEKHNLLYKRFYVRDHYPPSVETLNEFVNFVNAIPKNHWVHYHCRGGAGRTTTFMILHDMIRNKKHNITVNDYFSRHSIKGKDLRRLPVSAPWKIIPAIRRYLLIKKFYNKMIGQK